MPDQQLGRLAAAARRLRDAPSTEQLGAAVLDGVAELLEAHAGPTLTYDDLLDLHLLLERPDWWSRLVAACR